MSKGPSYWKARCAARDATGIQLGPNLIRVEMMPVQTDSKVVEGIVKWVMGCKFPDVDVSITFVYGVENVK